MQNCPSVEPEVIDNIESGELSYKVKIKLDYTMNKSAINYFNNLTLNQVYDAIDVLCSKEKKLCTPNSKLIPPLRHCKRELQDSYDRYLQELTETDYTSNTYYLCKDRIAKYAEKKKRTLASQECPENKPSTSNDRYQKCKEEVGEGRKGGEGWMERMKKCMDRKDDPTLAKPVLSANEIYQKCKTETDSKTTDRQEWMTLMKECMKKKKTASKPDCENKKKKLDDGTWLALMQACVGEKNLNREINLMQCSIPLWNFKEFVNKMHKYSSRKEDFYAFFGIENIFFKGQIEGQTQDGEEFKSCFKDGAFSGEGLIDNYLHQENIRSSPARAIE